MRPDVHPVGRQAAREAAFLDRTAPRGPVRALRALQRTGLLLRRARYGPYGPLGDRTALEGPGTGPTGP